KDYLAKDASQDEAQVYQQLMDKLSLLQDQAKQEKDSLRAQAQENEKKEVALNQYQKLIRNIINSNVVASARIKRRDTIIEKKDETINQNEHEIAELESSVSEKQKEIQDREYKISQINSQL